MAPVNWSRNSLVAVIGGAFYNQGPPIVTHVEEGTRVVVVVPGGKGYRVIEPDGYLSGVVTLLAIPKVSAGATVQMEQLGQ